MKIDTGTALALCERANQAFSRADKISDHKAAFLENCTAWAIRNFIESSGFEVEHDKAGKMSLKVDA